MDRILGLTARDRLTLIALSALLAAVTIWSLIAARSAGRPLPDRQEAAIRVDINSADIRQLTLLPGIGEKTARLIVADREANGRYKTVEDLARVKGIGPSVIRRIGPYADCR
jgi:competence protein ComEA